MAHLKRKNLIKRDFFRDDLRLLLLTLVGVSGNVTIFAANEGIGVGVRLAELQLQLAIWLISNAGANNETEPHTKSENRGGSSSDEDRFSVFVKKPGSF